MKIDKILLVKKAFIWIEVKHKSTTVRSKSYGLTIRILDKRNKKNGIQYIFRKLASPKVNSWFSGSAQFIMIVGIILSLPTLGYGSDRNCIISNRIQKRFRSRNGRQKQHFDISLGLVHYFGLILINSPVNVFQTIRIWGCCSKSLASSENWKRIHTENIFRKFLRNKKKPIIK